jgi:hypothetical protein
MTSQDRREGYLAKAKEAKEQARRFMDQDQRESWLQIARGYLVLAGSQEAAVDDGEGVGRSLLPQAYRPI